jgi:hypothetical protein
MSIQTNAAEAEKPPLDKESSVVVVHSVVRRCRLVLYYPGWPEVRTKWADSEESFDEAKKRAREMGCTFVTEYAAPNAKGDSR